MSKAIEEMGQYEVHQRFMRLAAMQDDFSQHYSALITDDRQRDDFRRELIYLVHAIYREAQEPLVKQLTDFVMTHTRPFIVGEAAQ